MPSAEPAAPLQRRPPMRHVSAEMLSAGIAALRPYRRKVPGLIAIEADRAPDALSALFRAMNVAGFGKDKTAALRTRRMRAKRKAQGLGRNNTRTQ